MINDPWYCSMQFEEAVIGVFIEVVYCYCDEGNEVSALDDFSVEEMTHKPEEVIIVASRG